MLLGIDIGTSSIKAMVMEEDGNVIGIKAKGYEVHIPREGWAEQNPQEWWEALCEILQGLKAEYPKAMSQIFRSDAWTGGCRQRRNSCTSGNHMDGSESDRRTGRNRRKDFPG